ncbi:hypothetical protein HDF10_000808 [Edaphobacter lichenicola]|uniref:Uncharacterized protein n=1 Tax=Tunturiibacter lichenicola TaxID=2051959 RepID=A0A7W8N2X2_9BACT|nr:hypothetical protein [Edaphobacter lichenicola]
MDQNSRVGSCGRILVCIAFRFKSSQYRGLVFPTRFFAGIAAPLIGLFSLFLLTAQGCESHGKLIVFPDGRHAARMMVYGNVPGGTSIWVITRRTWSPLWEEVASGFSIGTLLEPIEPTIVWTDNSHLNLDFPVGDPSDTSYSHVCQNKQVGDILIVCKTHMRKQ